MKRIQKDNVEYILVKEPTKKAGYIVQWYTKLKAAIESGSIKNVFRTLQALVENYHDSCVLLERIPEPQYQMILMMNAGTSQYKKHSLKFIAKAIGWDRKELLELTVFLLNTMEPELIDSPTYTGVWVKESDTALLNKLANMRFSWSEMTEL